ncbi:MAG: hypothetical protein ACR2HE_06740 [Casimicrobiaceae bacterium]
MGIFDQLFGGDKAKSPTPVSGQRTGQHEATTDQQAIERYRYMLKSAPPETIEQAHAQAFAQLTPEQRRMVGEQLSAEVPEAERVVVMQDGASPHSLARLATRAEVRNPGTMERTFGRLGGGGLGGLMAGTFLGSMAGAVVGTMIAQQFFGGDTSFGAGGANEAATDVATGNDQGAGTYEGPADTFGGDIGGGGGWDV